MTTGKLFIVAVFTAGLVCLLTWVQGGFYWNVPMGVTVIPAATGSSERTVKAEVSKMVGEVTMPGMVIAREVVTITAPIEGRVLQFDVEPGKRVKKGELLLQLGTQELADRAPVAAAALENAIVERDKAAGDLDRYKALLENESVDQKEIDEAQSRYEAAKVAEERSRAEFEETEAQLLSGRILAPFDGIIAGREINVGDDVTVEKPLLTLYNSNSFEFQAAVPARYAPYLAPGASVVLSFDPIELKQTAPIREITAREDSKGKELIVSVSLKYAQGLVPGLYGTLMFYAKASEAVTVPAEAIITTGRLESVKVREDGAVKIRQVKTGRKLDDGRIEIVAGLSPGEEVVVKSIDKK